jgi:hypothetical protein
MLRYTLPLILASCLSATAADIRDHVRLSGPPATRLTPLQADVLTLTLTQVQVRAIQNWLRVAGTVDTSGRMLSADVDAHDARSVAVGDRVRVFSADSKSSMYQAQIVRVTLQHERARVDARLSAAVHDFSVPYLLEVVVTLGDYLSVPNEAILEEGDQQLVYVQEADGSYRPHPIQTRLQGERYTEVLDGVVAGQQVVTTGSFFIDAEYRMKGGN